MTEWQILLHLSPYLLSFVLSASIGVYAWQRRKQAAGAGAFACFSFAQAFWTSGYIFELLAPSLEAKIFWDDVQFIALFLMPMPMLLFVHRYTERPIPYRRFAMGAVTAVAILSVLVVYTEPWHGLVRVDAELRPGQPFSTLWYSFTPFVLVTSLYAYGLLFYVALLLLGRLLYGQRLYRVQTALILAGVVLPIFGTLVAFLEIPIAAQRDVAPLMFGFGGLLVAWGLFRHRLFDLVPLARERVFESTGDSILVVDEQGRIVDINRAGLEYLEQTAGEVVGRPVADVFSPWAHLVEQFLNVPETRTEIEAVAGGRQQWFELRISPIWDRNGQLSGRVVVTRNITERKQAELDLLQRTAELELANQRLEALSRVKDDFVANVSHELRTPITSLKLNLGLLKKDPERHEVYTGRIEREIQRLERIIEDLLHLSRLDQGRVELEFTQVNLHTLASELVSDRTPLAESVGLQLVYEPAAEPLLVEADAGLLGQALSILLTNSLSYTPAGGRVMVSTGVRRDNGRPWCAVQVADTGHGIPPEEQERLFTRFFRGKVGRESGRPGTGLGLAIAHEIVDKHGGRIEVHSEGAPGLGTTFTILLPAV